MERIQKIIDVIFIVILCLAAAALLFATVFPATQNYNPFKLMVGNKNGINEVVSAELRNTNILKSLEENVTPSLYKLGKRNDAKTLYLDEYKEKKPYFKSFNAFDIYLEGFSKPEVTEGGFEVYGAFGVEITLPEAITEGGELAERIRQNGDGLYIPYFYNEIRKEGSYLAAVDLSRSRITLERLGEDGFTEVASVSGYTFERILVENGGACVLRNSDGSLILDSAVYRLTLSFAQVLASSTEEGERVLRVDPAVYVHYFNQNLHECANGVLTANNANESDDVQINIVGDGNRVSYSPDSEIYAPDGLTLGVSLSEKRLEKLAGFSAKRGLSLKLRIMRFDPQIDAYVELECREIMDKNSIFVNKTFRFEGEKFKTGRYRIIVEYDSRYDKIEQAYDYYVRIGG